VLPEHPDESARPAAAKTRSPAACQARQRAVPQGEATKFTEDYVGRDVEADRARPDGSRIDMARERLRKDVRAKAELAAEDRVLDALCGTGASEETRLRFRHKRANGELATGSRSRGRRHRRAPCSSRCRAARRVGRMTISGHAGQGVRRRTKKRNDDRDRILRDPDGGESDKLLDQERVVREARESVRSRTASSS